MLCGRTPDADPGPGQLGVLSRAAADPAVTDLAVTDLAVTDWR
ncbi:MAG TPA: hypothetical protein VII33_04920 [Nakamurella sp.]